MKQRFFNGLVIALVLASGVEGYAEKPPIKPREKDVSKIASQANRPRIPVTVPPTVRVIMKRGQPKSGRLIAIDSKQITLFSGNNSSVPIAAIDKMVFSGEVKLRSGGTIVIRGDNNQASSNNNQKNWQEPLRNFRMKDPTKGQAEVILTSVTDPLKLEGITKVLANSSYILEEIEFKPSEKIEITVTPH
jgi:small nuclear ribonucleoprotein (snRNP)-like protein